MKGSSSRSTGRVYGVAVRAMVLFTAVLGIGYTLVITGVGQLVLPARADGSLVRGPTGQIVGSSLIGQSFTDANGNPLPRYFQPRPSAAGKGYDAGASSGSNYGPDNTDLVNAITARKAQVAQFNGVSPDQVPPDAVTASGSGLDPDISPQYARLQVDRVARARNLPVEQVQQLVAAQTRGPALGYIGGPTVNVLELNLALDRLHG